MNALPVGIAAWQALSNLGSSTADLRQALCSHANHFSLNRTFNAYCLTDFYPV